MEEFSRQFLTPPDKQLFADSPLAMVVLDAFIYDSAEHATLAFDSVAELLEANSMKTDIQAARKSIPYTVEGNPPIGSKATRADLVVRLPA